MTVNDVVQFNERHKWRGSLGIISEDKGFEHPRRYLIGVPIPNHRVHQEEGGSEPGGL